MAELVPLAAELPSVLLALVVADAFADSPTSLIEALRTRTWQRGDIDALRRIIVAVHPSEPAFAQELAATHAAMCAAEPLLLPSLWPVRTGGASPRVAWLMPAPDSALFAPACAAVRETLQHLGRTDVTMTIVCAGDPDVTRAALSELPVLSAFLRQRGAVRPGHLRTRWSWSHRYVQGAATSRARPHMRARTTHCRGRRHEPCDTQRRAARAELAMQHLQPRTSAGACVAPTSCAKAGSEGCTATMIRRGASMHCPVPRAQRLDQRSRAVRKCVGDDQRLPERQLCRQGSGSRHEVVPDRIARRPFKRTRQCGAARAATKVPAAP